MSDIQLIERQGTTPASRVRIAPVMTMTWRELCADDAKRTAMALELAGFAGLVGGTVADHAYSTRTGFSSCSPPV
ncbi:hypothetical protein [uncultured Friedmanniella sp.]|uniref:hypothetical protein n=1 Tax=uncultured Friedmanniella sp. TaxID=335381 RepID=UPI0035CA2471